VDANKNPVTEAAFGLFLIWIGVSFYGYLSRARWLNEIRYSSWYNVSTERVKQLEDKPPTDCDFFRAPIGFKGCTYEKTVSVEKAITGNDTRTNRPIVSYDEGKTWTWNDEGTPVLPNKTVYVTWRKVDD
jgi:hypothetical protein